MDFERLFVMCDRLVGSSEHAKRAAHAVVRLGIVRPDRERLLVTCQRFLEPGPIVLVSSLWKGKANIMTMGWHMVAETSPSLIACYIWDEDYTRRIVERTRECVINIPTVELLDTAIRIGNSTGEEIDNSLRAFTKGGNK